MRAKGCSEGKVNLSPETKFSRQLPFEGLVNSDKSPLAEFGANQF